MRLDDLAREAGVPTTTVRLYQNKGLLAPPEVRGRTGYYGSPHLSRLRLIARLQGQGFSLAGIRTLLEQWERGGDLDGLVGVEAGLDALVGDGHAVVLDPTEVIGRFPPGAMTPEQMQRAGRLGLVEVTGDGRVRIADRRFLDTGAALAHLGLPVGVILDEWEHLVAHTDAVARRFMAVFDEHLAPPDWRHGLDREQADRLAATLAQLQAAARQVVVAALDAAIARLGRERLAALAEPEPPGATRTRAARPRRRGP